MSPPTDTASLGKIELAIRDRLRAQVDGFPETIGANQDLQLTGVNSLDLIVVLSQLERDFSITLSDIYVAKGHSISSIAARMAISLGQTAVGSIHRLPE